MNANTFKKDYVSYEKTNDISEIDKIINGTYIFDASDISGVIDGVKHLVLSYMAEDTNADINEVRKESIINVNRYNIENSHKSLQRAFIKVCYAHFDLMIVIDFEAV